MKVAIIILGNSWVCPYVNTYKSILEKCGVGFDVILWDRDGSDAGRDGTICFNAGTLDLGRPLSKLYGYIEYARFIKKTVLERGYEKLVVSGPHLAILLSSFLRRKFRGRYMLDYRDISVEQFPFLSWLYSRTLSGSRCNVISSSGFKKHLPRKYGYAVSHNFNVDDARRALAGNAAVSIAAPWNVLTIGSIRNFSSNVQVLRALAGNASCRMNFVGAGDASARLERYAAEHDIRNAAFVGYYKKEDEASYVKDASFINIYFPSDVEHSAIMSNRFYLSLIYKKPMIVTAGSVQAALVEKYGLGVVVADTARLCMQLEEYAASFDPAGFAASCNRLLAEFVKEHERTGELVRGFVLED